MLTVITFLTLLGFALLVLTTQFGGLSSATTSMTDDASLRYTMEAAQEHATWSMEHSGCSAYSTSQGQIGNASYEFSFTPTSGSPVSTMIDATLNSGRTASRILTNQKSYASSVMNTVAITAGAYIELDKTDHNHGTDNHIHLGNDSAKTTHALLYIDLSSIPANAVIARAEIELEVTDDQGGDDESVVERITEAWNEESVTWLVRQGTDKWTTQGGTTSTATYGSFYAVSGSNRADITPLVREWHAGANNYGMLLRFATPANGEVKFESDDKGSLLLHVYYKCECGASCAVDNVVSCDANFRPNSKRAALTDDLTEHRGITFVSGNVTLAGIIFPEEGGMITADTRALKAYDVTGALLGTCAPDLSKDITGISFVTGGNYANHLLVVDDHPTPEIHRIATACTVVSSWKASDTELSTVVDIGSTTFSTSHEYANHILLADGVGNTEIYTESGSLAKTIPATLSDGEVGGIAHVPNQELFLLANNQAADIVTVDFLGTIQDRYDFSRFGATSVSGLGIDLTDCDHLLPHSAGLTNEILHALPLSADPIAHWRLDEASGIVAEDYIGGHNGTLVGGEWASDGAVQSALTLDSDFNEHVNVPNTAPLSITDELTISGWIFPDRTNDYHVLISKGPGTTQNYWLGIAGGYLAFIYDDGTFNFITTTTLVTAGQWHHMAASYSTSSGQLNLYLNGSLAHNETVSGTLSESTEPVLLGTSWSGGAVDGRIDDIKLFNAELTAADIQLLYQDGIIATPAPDRSSSPSENCENETYHDEFNLFSFAGTDGTLDWLDPWYEIGESNGPNAGDIRIRNTAGVQYLRVRDNDNGGEGVARTVDLSLTESASLTFDYARLQLSDPDYVSISILANSVWSELGQIRDGNEQADAMLTQAYDLTSYVGDVVEIRFLTSEDMPNNSGVMLDNITVKVCQ